MDGKCHRHHVRGIQSLSRRNRGLRNTSCGHRREYNTLGKRRTVQCLYVAGNPPFNRRSIGGHRSRIGRLHYSFDQQIPKNQYSVKPQLRLLLTNGRCEQVISWDCSPQPFLRRNRGCRGFPAGAISSYCNTLCR